VHEQEGSAVDWIFKKERHKLLGRQIDLYTDNNALRYLLIKPDMTAKVASWVSHLMDFDITVHHLPGVENTVADVLSRNPLGEADMEHEASRNSIKFASEILSMEATPTEYERDLHKVTRFLQDFEYLEIADETLRRQIWQRSKRFYLIPQKGEVQLFRLVKTEKLQHIVPRSKRRDILARAHNEMGHFGRDGVYQRIKEDSWWPKLYEDVKDYVRTCTACQQFEKLSVIVPVQPVEPKHIFQTWGCNIIGPINPVTERGHQYILVFVEYFTKWVVAVPLQEVSAAIISKAIYEQIYVNFGLPEEILMDNASFFVAEGLRAFMDLLAARHLLPAGYHPQCNGLCKHINGTLIEALAKLVYKHPEDWDLLLPCVVYAYRTKVHSSFKKSPFEVLYGCQPRKDGPLANLGRLELQCIQNCQDVRREVQLSMDEVRE
jgi:hypothetical protein